MAPSARRRRAHAGSAVPGAAEGLAVRGSSSDWEARDSPELQARAAEEVLRRLVSSGPDGGRGRGRLRQGRDAGDDRKALRRAAARVQSASAPELRRAEAAGHAVCGGHGPGSVDDAGHRLQQDGVPRSVHRRRLSPADRRTPLQLDAERASHRDCPEAGRAVPQRRHRPRPVREVGRGVHADGARQGRQHRPRARNTFHRSRTRDQVRLHVVRARARKGIAPARAVAADDGEGQAPVQAAGRRVHPELHAGRAVSRPRLRSGSDPEGGAGDFTDGGQRPGEGVDAGGQPRGGHQRPAEGHAQDSGRSGAGSRHQVRGRQAAAGLRRHR